MESLMMKQKFHILAQKMSNWVGSPWAFVLSVLGIFIWAITGPIFKFSDTWQLIINTSTTIITFLMVFLIQNTQNRDARAVHLKLDELIRASAHARNHLIDLENLEEEELDELHEEFCRTQKINQERLEDIEEVRAEKKQKNRHRKG
jgi:low affinity Fe/Cu permease